MLCPVITLSFQPEHTFFFEDFSGIKNSIWHNHLKNFLYLKITIMLIHRCCSNKGQTKKTFVFVLKMVILLKVMIFLMYLMGFLKIVIRLNQIYTQAISVKI